MRKHKVYANADHPTVSALAHKLMRGNATEKEVFGALFEYVRNEVLFGFPPVWEKVKASQTLDYGMGYCNTKSTLLLALCRVAGLETMLHAGRIDARIMEHIVPGWALDLLPETVPHMWVDVKLESEWHSVDAYILDRQFLEGARGLLLNDRSEMGYGLCLSNPSSAGNWDEGFVQTAALVEDHGLWDDPGEYFADSLYAPLAWWQLSSYPFLRQLMNRNIDRIRRLCGQKKDALRIEENIPALKPA